VRPERLQEPQRHLHPPPSDTLAPTTAITSPANGTTVAKRSSITIQASASDAVGVVRVDVYVGTTLKCSDSSAPYSCQWKVPTGTGKSYNLQSLAYDAAGNMGPSAIVKVAAR